MSMQVKEAIVRLINTNQLKIKWDSKYRTKRDSKYKIKKAKTLWVAKYTTWNILKKKECKGQAKKSKVNNCKIFSWLNKKTKKSPQTDKLLYRTLVTSRKLKRRNIYLCQNLQSEDAFMNLKSDGFLVVLKNKKVCWSNWKTSKRVWPVQDKNIFGYMKEKCTV